MRPLEQLEAADPDAFDPNVYIDRTGEEALAATEELLLGMGAKKLSETEFVYDDLHMVKGTVGIDPVWTIHWNSWHRTWPETRGIAKVLQSRLQDFVNEYQRLIDDAYDHKRAFTLAREHLKESVDPDDPASFIARVEQPEDVLRELGFVNLKHQPVWSRDDGSVRTVVEKADATHWRITSWMPGSKHTLPVMKEFDWFDLRKGIEWALPRTAKWARPGSTDWAVKLAHKALGEATDPDDIDVGNYLAVGDPTFTKLYHMGFELVPETDADIEHMALMLHSNLIIKVYKNVADGYYARLEDETGVGCLGSFATKQGGRVVGQIRQWIKEHSKRWHQMRESADPDDIDPKRYLDGISSHELLDTSTPGGSSRSTCCTCGKWCFSGLVRDEAERLEYENLLRTEWERHRAFATERVEPVSREYMLRVGTPYRWGESADPDDFDPKRYLNATKPAHGYVIVWHSPEWGKPSYYVTGPQDGGGKWIEGTRYATHWTEEKYARAYKKKWLDAWHPGEIHVEPLSVLSESSDPDDIDPQRYVDEVAKDRMMLHAANFRQVSKDRWVRDRRNTTVEITNMGRSGWMLTIRGHAWSTSTQYMTLHGAIYANTELQESADPDDINFDSYVLNAWEELLRSKGFQYQPKGNPYWYRINGIRALCIRQSDREPGSIEVIEYRVDGPQWEQIQPAFHIPVKKLYLVIESADPDDIDPQRYLSAIRVVWVIKWNDAYYEANSHSHGHFAGGEWKLKPDHATRWVSREAAQSWFDKNLRPWYQNAEVVPVERRLSESADPDEINPQRYLDAAYDPHIIAWRNPEWIEPEFYKAHKRGGRWITDKSKATVWPSRVEAEAYWRTWFEPNHPDLVQVEPLNSVNESADPDDINPEHYLDAVASTAGPLELRARLQAAFRGSFMRPEYYFSGYREVETNAGTYIVPADVMDSDDPDDYLDYVEGRINEVSERREGWVYRTSASGYMDASEWGVAGSEEEAIDALIDNYGDADAGLEDGLEESADPDDVDPKQWLDNIALSRERLREIIRGIPRTFHIGFSITCSTPEDDEVAAAAQEERVNVDLAWEAINEDWPRIERNVQKWMSSHGIHCRSEGHDGDGDLVGSVFIDLAVPTNFDFFEQYMQHEEPWRTSSGTFPNEADVYADTSVFSHLIDVDLDLFDYAKCEVAFEHMVDSGVTLKKLNGVWTGVSPARDVDEAADPDEPNMARWVERLSAEAQLNRIFNEQGMPYFRDDPKGATNWSRWFRWGEFEVWTTFTIFHKGENAPSGHLSYEIKHGTFHHKNSEFVRGPDNILKMIDLFDRALAGLNQTPPKKVSDIIRAFETPLRWAYSMERYGEDTA